MIRPRAPFDEDNYPAGSGGLLFRTTDPETSREAGEDVRPRLPELQRRVVRAFEMRGPMTAKECESLDCFADLGFSTVRKRCSELVAVGVLEQTAEKRNRCYVLRVAR